jgi:hypothetical protein
MQTNPEGSYFIHGPYGCGKTHLLYAQYRGLVLAGVPCNVRTSTELLSELQRMEFDSIFSGLLLFQWLGGCHNPVAKIVHYGTPHPAEFLASQSIVGYNQVKGGASVKREYNVLYQPIEDGWIMATVPELPGAVTPELSGKRSQRRSRQCHLGKTHH